MLKVRCKDHLREVWREVKAAGKLPLLRKGLRQMYGDGTWFGHEVTFVLSQDFAPWSFGWWIEDSAGRPGVVGGLIHHGNGSSGSEYPVLSVRVGETNECWSVHT